MKQSPLNEMKITFPSYSENERFARLAVSGFLSQLDPSVEELSDVKTAVSEAVTNAIVHGYKNQTGLVLLQMKIFRGGKIYIKIQDKGCGIENIKQAMEPMFTTAAKEERAGLGFAVMEAFMEKVKVTSKLGKGTAVVLEKTIVSGKRCI